MKLSQLEALVKVMRDNAITSDPNVTFWQYGSSHIDLDIEQIEPEYINMYRVVTKAGKANLGDYQIPLFEV